MLGLYSPRRRRAKCPRKDVQRTCPDIAVYDSYTLVREEQQLRAFENLLDFDVARVSQAFFIAAARVVGVGALERGATEGAREGLTT